MTTFASYALLLLMLRIDARIPSANVTVVPSYVSAPMPTVEPTAVIICAFLAFASSAMRVFSTSDARKGASLMISSVSLIYAAILESGRVVPSNDVEIWGFFAPWAVTAGAPSIAPWRK